MGIFARLFGARRTAARYDAASQSRQARRKWEQADFLLPRDSLSREVRLTIKSRARYECENVAWLAGMVAQYAEDVVSTGPRLQIESRPEIEAAWNRWAAAVDLPGRLRLAVLAKVRDGECFIQLTSNPAVEDEAKLFPLILDSARIAAPDASGADIDGVWLDQYLEPVRYSVAKEPDDPAGGFYTVDAAHMCHFYRAFAPEQRRGVSDLAPALPAVAMLRAYTVAVLNKMEASAAVVGVLEPDTAVIDPDQINDPPFTPFDMPARSWMSLPAGYKSKQFASPATADSQNAFAETVKCEVARCILATKNVVLGDSSSYNYSSARLDMQSYDRAIEVARQEVERALLDKIFRAWWRERYGDAPLPAYHYYWTERAFINPLQESKADSIRLANGSLTYQALCAADGHDWQETMRLRFEAEAYRRALEKKYGFALATAPDASDAGEADAPQ